MFLGNRPQLCIDRRLRLLERAHKLGDRCADIREHSRLQENVVHIAHLLIVHGIHHAVIWNRIPVNMEQQYQMLGAQRVP